MDETADSSTTWEYQKRVAALVALTQQVINIVTICVASETLLPFVLYNGLALRYNRYKIVFTSHNRSTTIVQATVATGS